MVECETAFFGYSARFIVAFAEGNPQALFCKGAVYMSDKRLYCFGHKTAAPEGAAYPIAYFGIVGGNEAAWARSFGYEAATSYGLACLFENYGICLGCREYIADYHAAHLHRGVLRPACGVGYHEVGGVLIEGIGIVVGPGAEYESVGFYHNSGVFCERSLGCVFFGEQLPETSHSVFHHPRILSPIIDRISVVRNRMRQNVAGS